jgi:putative ABC transport system permease protein
MVIGALHRKLFRDIWKVKMQGLAIALVVASGIALYVGMAATARSLTLSKQQFYDSNRFTHVWSRLSRAPESVVTKLSAIPGVAAVEGRLVVQGVLDLSGVDEPANGLFISIPETNGQRLNDLYLRRGRNIEKTNADEVLVNESFAEKNSLKPGDSVRTVIAGQALTLHIVGVALSPEFLMPVPPGGLVPDERRFGVFWLAHDRLATLLDMHNAINDVAIRLTDSSAGPAVIAEVDRVLDVYGGEGAFGRTSQPSDVMLEDHITPLAALAAIVPAIFLGVAVFLVNVVLSRLVATERPQIGMMKAFGYSNSRLAAHYLLLALSIVTVGIALGLPVGVWLGHAMSRWFATFFRFPVLVFRIEAPIVFLGTGVMLTTAAAGSLWTLRKVVGMPPVVAMTAPAPVYVPTVFERISILKNLWSPVTRMILRSVTRHPARALLTAGGLSAAISIVVLGGFLSDAVERIIDVRFQVQQHQDLTVVLTHPRSLETWREFNSLPGVRKAEPFRSVAARIREAGEVRDVRLIGLEPSSQLRRVVDSNYHETTVPPNGLLVNTWLATQLGLRRGQQVTLEIRQHQRRLVTARIVGLVDEPVGTDLYMDLRELGLLLEEPNTFSAVDLLVDPTDELALYAALKRAPQALGVESRKIALTNFRAMPDQSIGFIRKIETIFAVIIAFGVVYNTARIAVAERSYELATLRVLGFTRSEISAVLLGEVGVLAAPAVPLGCLIGYGLSVYVGSSVSTALLRMPVVVNSSTYAFAVLVFVVSALGSALIVRRRLDHLDLVEVLKVRE